MLGDNKGAILLLSLLIMSGILIVGSSLGTISLLSLRQARIIDDSVIAFAAAESGAEQTLYQIRRAATDVSTLSSNDQDDSSTQYSGLPMNNGSSWKRTISTTETTLYTTIPENKTYEVVLWDPDSPTSRAGVESMTYSWDDNCGGTSAIEVLVAGWDPQAGGGFTPLVEFHGTSLALTFLRTPPRVTDNGYSALKAYRVRIRAKRCDIFNLAINAYDADDGAGGSGSLVDIPSRIIIASNGTFVSARQALEIRLPRLQPLSGVFDYVIFSQCSILKGVVGPACP